MLRQNRNALLSVAIAAAVITPLGLLAGMSVWDVGLSVGLFAFAVCLVLAVFGQPGRAKLSPQRAAAIAAGHADRKTVFEYGPTRPVMWMLLAVSHSLNAPRIKGWLNRKLTASGNPNYYTADEYLALTLLSGLTLAAVLVLFMLVLTDRFSIAMLLIGLVVGGVLSLHQIHSAAEKRLRLISRRVPYALDLISLAMGAGANFAEAVRTIVRERGEDPLNAELRTVLAEMELGTPRRVALQNLSRRVPLESLQSIIASIIQAEELGTPLGNVLHDQANLLRLQRSVRAENKAAVASVRILIPCLLLVLAVMLTVFGPAIVRTAREGLF